MCIYIVVAEELTPPATAATGLECSKNWIKFTIANPFGCRVGSRCRISSIVGGRRVDGGECDGEIDRVIFLLSCCCHTDLKDPYGIYALSYGPLPELVRGYTRPGEQAVLVSQEHVELWVVWGWRPYPPVPPQPLRTLATGTHPPARRRRMVHNIQLQYRSRRRRTDDNKMTQKLRYRGG